ncbi:MAG: AAA family ATPase [Atopobiaceae bacterium]|nr:AAA family ATPase [Atopobiaceae bacterium]
MDGSEIQERAQDAGLEDTLAELLARPRDEAVSEIERTVIGQDAVVEEVVDLMYACLERMLRRAEGTDELDLPRACAFMLAGTTASGKSFLMKVAARVLKLPIVTIDCTGITGAGWAGDSVSSELRRVAHALTLAPGTPVIAFWDEADKLVRSTSGQNRGFDAQGNFLKLLDGETMVLEPEQPGQKELTLDTSRILNVFAGAFMGIEDIVKKRLLENKLTVAGTKSAHTLMDKDALYAEANLEDLITWGFMPELVGRFGAVVSVPALSRAALRKIVKGSERSLERRIQNLLGPGKTFEIEDDAADAMAQEAKRSGLGARRIDQLANRYAAHAIAGLQDPKGPNRATLVCAEDGLELAFDRVEELAEAGKAVKAEADAATPETVELPKKNVFAPDEDLEKRVNKALAGARFGDAAKTREGRELLSRRIAAYKGWHLKDQRTLPAAELLLASVMGYLVRGRGSALTLGETCAYIRFADVAVAGSVSYLDILFFGRVDTCGIRGLEERATEDAALATPDTLAALSAYRRFSAYPEAVRKEAVKLAQARALAAMTSEQEAAWLRSDINDVAVALDKENPFGDGPSIMF